MSKRIQSVSKQSDVGMGGIHGKKAAVVSLEEEFEDMDVEEQISCIEGLSDENDSMWLSSDSKSKSSSFLSSDNSQDTWELDCWDLFLHDRYSSMLSLSESCEIAISNVSGINPIKDVSVDLESKRKGKRVGRSQEQCITWQQNSTQNELESSVGKRVGRSQEQCITWQQNSTQNELESSVGCSENGDSPYEGSLCEGSSVFGSSSTSLSTLEDQPSRVGDFHRTDTSISSLDLEGDDTYCVWQKGQEFDVFSSDFLSPSFNFRRSFHIRPCDSRSKTPGQAIEISSQLEDSKSDEPIFWPFDYNSYWQPELDRFLCISPQKDRRNNGASRVDESKSLRMGFYQRRNSPLDRKNTQEGCRKRLTFDSTPTSTASEGKTRSLGHSVPRIGPVPTRLSRATRASPEENPSKIFVNKKPHQLKANRQNFPGDQGLLVKSLLDLEDFEIPKLVAEGVSIEKLVGLHEFDGHEGITTEFNEDNFCLVESPCKNAKAVLMREDEQALNNNDHDRCSYVTTGSCQSDQVIDDFSKAYAKSQEDPPS